MLDVSFMHAPRRHYRIGCEIDAAMFINDQILTLQLGHQQRLDEIDME
jgi:hypothetical protein